jgi:DNA-binding GntR family transcriptional regulator
MKADSKATAARPDRVLMPLGAQADPPTLADQAYEVIQQAILDESYQPGDHLSVPAISKELGISRSPVREAILRLEQEGLVRTIPRRGAVVVGVTFVELLKLYEVREFLEGLAARLAAEKVTDGQIADLKKQWDEHSKAVEAGDVAAHMAIDQGFHTQVFDAAANHYVAEMRLEIQNQIRLGLTSTAAVPGNPPKALEEHKRILEALVRRDPDRAEQAARAHIRRIIDTLHLLAEEEQS